MRAVAAAPLIDDTDPAKSERACADAERSIEQIRESAHELARPGFAPHAVYSVSERSLRWVAERAAELDIPVQIHLSETEDEVAGCVEANGCGRPTTSTAWGCSGPGRCWPTAAGSTAVSST